MHVNVETPMSHNVSSERTMSPTGLFKLKTSNSAEQLGLYSTLTDVTRDTHVRFSFACNVRYS